MVENPKTFAIPSFVKSNWFDSVTEIVMDVYLEEKEYRYTYRAKIDQIVEEILEIRDKKNPESKFQNLLHRFEGKVTIDGTFLSDVSSMTYSSIRKIGIEQYDSADPRSLIVPFYRYLTNMMYVFSDGSIDSSFTESQKMSDIMVKQSDAIRDFQKNYSVYFPAYSITKNEPTRDKPDGSVSFNVFKDPEHPEAGSYSFSENMISDGIRSQSKVISVMSLLPKGSLIVIDEVDNSLHTLVLSSFIEEARKRGYQLLCSTHDTNIMEEMRPDQIYFAHWSNGSSKIHRLSDIYPTIREVNNIEKMYLSGVFNERIEK
jgi:AAA15 family ATPase/GTPase